MVLNAILGVIDNILGWVLDKIPNINVDISDFSEKFQYLVDLGESMNYFLPVKEALTLVGVILGIKLAMLLFWASMRVINLIRGAG